MPILEQIAAACPSDTVIASSTSGIKPSDLQPSITNPERLVVGHPYNPVYLVPVVEVVGGDLTSRDAIDAAMATYDRVSMKPIHVRVEIDAFIGDGFLSAQRAIDLARRLSWAVDGGRAGDFALSSFATVVVGADFSNDTLGKILSQAESSSAAARDLLTQALGELEVGSPN